MKINRWKVGFFVTLILLISCITISTYVIFSLFADLQLFEKYHKGYEEDLKSISLSVQEKSKSEIRKELDKNSSYYLETDSSISLNNVILFFDKDSLFKRVEEKGGGVKVSIRVIN